MNEIIEKFLKEHVLVPQAIHTHIRNSLYNFVAENPITVWHKIKSKKDCPDDDREVIACTDSHKIITVRYVLGQWTDNIYCIHRDVIAWTELPEYKGE